MRTEIAVTCPVPGYTDVVVTYDLMATAEDVDLFRVKMDEESARKVISKVEGYTGGLAALLSAEQPFALRLWLAYKGFQQALQEFILSPN